MKKNCLNCKKEFKTYPCRIKIGLGKYCGKPCADKARIGDKGYWLGKKRPELITSNAGRTMFRKGDKVWNKGKSWDSETKLKMSRNRKGKTALEKNPNWRGGLYAEHLKIRWSDDYKKWRKAVFERDNYTCVECNQYGKRLNADHIKPFSLFPELRLEISNGRTLCVDCHMKTDTYGNKINNMKRKEVVPYVHTDWK